MSTPHATVVFTRVARDSDATPRRRRGVLSSGSKGDSRGVYVYGTVDRSVIHILMDGELPVPTDAQAIRLSHRDTSF